ncbi:hypothetical protein L9H26_08070 [Morganella psychrotolerans]|uniref:SMODS and SLOG-associating 2TM effector domain-containing protein n=1 Tax=Morganella psychrotolerans TaxID=368603 RepID=A0A5M9RBA5_9GAMM|nr:hypothetical protein [Morganella psychrotolerans]KAA8716725.1 hypothetical protein F4V73_02275 [Morganella psychrotolerans]
MNDMITEKYIHTLNSLIERSVLLNDSIRYRRQVITRLFTINIIYFFSLTFLFSIFCFFLLKNDMLSKNISFELIPLLFTAISLIAIFATLSAYNFQKKKRIIALIDIDINQLENLLSYIDDYKMYLEKKINDSFERDDKNINVNELIDALNQANFKLRYIQFSYKKSV